MTWIFEHLDHIRSLVLRFTLKSTHLRRIFLIRPYRLFVSFCIVAGAQFVLASLFSRWLFVLGPIFLGIPHLFSGIRYIPKMLIREGTGKTLLTQATLGCLGFVFIPGVIQLLAIYNRGIFRSIPVSFLEIGFMAVFLVLTPWLLKKKSFSWMKFGLLAVPLGYGIFYHPIFTFGVITTGHNFIAYYFWYKSAQTRLERQVVLACIVVVALFTALFCSDLHLRLMELGSPWGPKGLKLHPFFLIEEIFPAVRQSRYIGQIVSWFVFCQGLHYFVWLKAIPEESMEQQVPFSFRRSMEALVRDLGPRLSHAAIVFSLLMVASIFYFDLVSVKTVYLLLASSHGYLEIAAIPFLSSSKSI